MRLKKLQQLQEDIQKYVEQQRALYSWGALDEKVAQLEEMGKMETEDDHYVNAHGAQAINEICSWVEGDEDMGRDFFSQYLIKREGETREIFEKIRKSGPDSVVEKNETTIIRFNVEYEKEVIEVKEYLKEFKQFNQPGEDGQPQPIPKKDVRILAKELKDVEATFDRADASVESLIGDLEELISQKK